jgi:hypothetical protein
VNNRLDLIVFNRSNDVYWGMLGANIVQFSFLQEYLARMAGLDIGRLFQVSTNAHVYLDFGPGADAAYQELIPLVPEPTPLDVNNLRPMLNFLFHLLAQDGGWQRLERDMFANNRFMMNVVYPMIMAHYRNDPSILEGYQETDWFLSMRIGKGWAL